MCSRIMVIKEKQVILSLFTSLRSPLICLLKLFYLKKNLDVPVWVYLHMSTGACRRQRLQVHLDLKLQMVGSCPTRVLGTELGLSKSHTYCDPLSRSSAYLLFNECLKSSRLAGFQWTIPYYFFCVQFVHQIPKCFSSHRTLLFWPRPISPSSF